jgi:dTDP-4-dehydrorhamnose reductase
VILLLGSSGYIGSRFADWFKKEQRPFYAVSRAKIDYTKPGELRALILKSKAKSLINCAGFTGKPNVDQAEILKKECLFGNAILPGIIAEECRVAGIEWAHLSSGCIYTGSKQGVGFTEKDVPNFDFRHNNCSWYSGTKALGEEILASETNCFIWRIRIPFEEIDNPRNYLSKLCRYPRLLEAENSLTHLGEFIREAIGMMDRDLPKGIYNMTQPGSITTRQVVKILQESGILQHQPEFFRNEEEFMKKAAQTPRSNCVLSAAKALSLGCRLTPIHEKIREVCKLWNG